MGYYKLRNVPPYTSIAIAEWLRRRGKAIRPELTRSELDELEECFVMIDADGSGAIDVDELHKAFKMLQLKVTRSKIKQMLVAGNLLKMLPDCIAGQQKLQSNQLAFTFVYKIPVLDMAP